MMARYVCSLVRITDRVRVMVTIYQSQKMKRMVNIKLATARLR